MAAGGRDSGPVGPAQDREQRHTIKNKHSYIDRFGLLAIYTEYQRSPSGCGNIRYGGMNSQGLVLVDNPNCEEDRCLCSPSSAFTG